MSCGLFCVWNFSRRNRRKPQRANVVCHEPEERSQSNRPAKTFLCAPYVADERGKYQPAGTLTECPVAKGAKRCRLRKHSWRRRKSGPCLPLRVLHCRRHSRYFTVYPIGHVPYSREPLVPVALSGHAIQRAENESTSRWEGSWFRGGGRCFAWSALAARTGGRRSFAGLLCPSTAIGRACRAPAGIVR